MLCLKKLFNSDTKYVALIDEIPYAINHESVEDELGVKLPRDRRSNKWVLKFKTGEITVSGSREDIEYVNSIKSDVKWLGFNWDKEIKFSSDYFNIFYDCYWFCRWR